jgi:hypothetical protein
MSAPQAAEENPALARVAQITLDQIKHRPLGAGGKTREGPVGRVDKVPREHHHHRESDGTVLWKNRRPEWRSAAASRFAIPQRQSPQVSTSTLDEAGAH